MPIITQGGGAQLKYHNSATPIIQPGGIVQDGHNWYMHVKATAAIAANEAVAMQPAHTSFDNITGLKNTVDIGAGQYPYIEDTGLSETPGTYVNSLLYIDAGTGAGQMKRIRENTATRFYFEALHKGFGTGFEDHPFSTSPDTTSDITIISPFHVIKTVATTLTTFGIGYAPFAFTANYWGFICVSGPALIKSGTAGAALVAGVGVSPGDDTAGQVTGLANGETIDDIHLMGWALHAAADNQAAPIWLAGNMV